MDIKPTYEALEESLSKAEKSIATLKASNRNGFIQKPFSMKQLSQKLREILD